MVAQAPTGARGLHCKRPGDAPCLRTRLEGNAGQARSLCNALFLSSAGRVPPVPAAETRRAEACAVGFPPQTGQHWGGPAPLSTAESRPRPQGRTGYPGPQAQSRTALPNPLPLCLRAREERLGVQTAAERVTYRAGRRGGPAPRTEILRSACTYRHTANANPHCQERASRSGLISH